MRTILHILLASIPLLGCGIIDSVTGRQTITPSDTMITVEPDVSSFTAIEMHTFGAVEISQGDSDSLTITGSDNVVPLVQASVRNGVLVLDMDRNVTILPQNIGDILAFTITVKELEGVEVSGLGDVQVGDLKTSDFRVDMSGAGQITIDALTAQTVDVDMSGLGRIVLAGTGDSLRAVISGAGSLEAGDLECQTATVNISGLGSATVWATDQLSGTISGSGNVRYYGDPQTDVNSTGLGNFESLGDK
jgi:hypothetical protein